MRKIRFIKQLLQGKRLPVPDKTLQIFPDLKDAHNRIDRAVIHRKPAVAAFPYFLQDFIRLHPDIDGIKVYTACQNALSRHIPELKGRRNQVALLLIQGSPFGHVLDNIVNLRFRDGSFRFSFRQLCDPVPDHRQQLRKGAQNCHQNLQQACAGKGYRSAVLSGNAFRKHLPKQENHYSGNQCGHRDGRFTEAPGYIDGHDGSSCQMHYIGADQDRRDRPVYVIHHKEGFHRLLLTPVRPDFQAGSRDRGKCRLNRRKKHCADKQQDNGQQKHMTAIVHKETTLLFYDRKRDVPFPVIPDSMLRKQHVYRYSFISIAFNTYLRKKVLRSEINCPVMICFCCVPNGFLLSYRQSDSVTVRRPGKMGRIPTGNCRQQPLLQYGECLCGPLILCFRAY